MDPVAIKVFHMWIHDFRFSIRDETPPPLYLALDVNHLSSDVSSRRQGLGPLVHIPIVVPAKERFTGV
ncbi:hypothetical protein AVEN_259885-1 [Araneus ventricosus]|uniref:Uncharacterized protein n=1 Tax=Araneus ventricosus TaxID=182803 RepID=A0A4Y2SXV8_ARAVE|nr:hypothetical protein AVEN_259885-1 [Araneus ventricosus]